MFPHYKKMTEVLWGTNGDKLTQDFHIVLFRVWIY
jgi:hypothetical protein